MNRYSLFHLEDGALRRGLVAAVPAFHISAASLIAHLAEFDARRLYAPEGYPSMCAFCVGELGLTDQVAKKLIRVGRTARRFPRIFGALADGRLNPSGVILLARWLTRENADELLDTAARKSNDEIRQLLTDRAPRMDVPLTLTMLAGSREVSVRTPGDAASAADAPGEAIEVSARTPGALDDPGVDGEPGDRGSLPTPRSQARLNPLGAGRYEARFTMTEATRGALARYEALLGRKADSAAIDAALERGLEALARDIEKRRYATTDRPRPRRGAARGRYIPAAIRRAVRERDGDRCSFVSESGRRCEARGRLEFDHVVTVARGGASTVGNLRLRCRAHNQYEADRTFGAGFMHQRRGRRAVPRDATASGGAHAAREAPGETASAMAAALATAIAPARETADPDSDVTPWLIRLGFRRQEAAAAAARCRDMAGASLEARVRAALAYLAPPARVDRPGPPRRT